MIPTNKDSILQRADAYHFFASCFLKEPTAEFLEGFKAVCSSMGSCNPFIQELTPMVESMSVEKVTQEYYDLLFIPVSGKYIPPFESALLDGEETEKGFRYGNLNGDRENQVTACFQQFFFEPKKLDVYDPLKGVAFADHLGFEIAFISFLCYQEASASSTEAAQQFRLWQFFFLEQHLILFIRKYAELVKTAKVPFYQAVCEAVNDFIQNDFCFLKQCGGNR